MVRKIGQAKAVLAADYTAQLARSVGLQIDASVEVRAELAERLAAHLAGSGAAWGGS